MMKKISQMNRNTLGIIGLILGIILFLCVNIISAFSFKNYRLDLTQAKLYSLSDGSIKAIQKIKEPITIRFYLSEKLATASQTHATYAIRVVELLEQYVSASDNKIKIEIINPEPFSRQEDEALAYGIKGIPVGNSSEYAYIGLTISNSSDRRRTIALLDPSKERFLEYDITKYISDMTQAKRPVIGIISTLPIDGRGEPHLVYPSYQPRWPIMTQIRDIFDVRFISRQTLKIPRNIDVLMLVNPKRFSEETLYEIDQYVMRGGNLLVLIDPFSETEYSLGETPYSVRPDMDKLFKTWGISFNPLVFVGDMMLARSASQTEGDKSIQTKFLPWLGLNEKYLNPADPITGTIQSVNLAYAGSFEVIERKDDITPTSLMFSSKDSQLFNTSLGVKPDAITMQRLFKSGQKNMILGMRLKGTPNSAFEKAPERYFLKQRTDSHILKAKSPVNIILIADSDFLTEKFWTAKSTVLGKEQLYPFAGNADLIINALDNLSGSTSLIELRAKSEWKRSFKVIDDLALKASKLYQKQETQLQQELALAQAKLERISKKTSKEDGQLLSKADKEELQRLKAHILEVRRALRLVQNVLSQDIMALQSMLIMFNVIFVPLLLIITSLFIVFRRRAKRNLKRKGR